MSEILPEFDPATLTLKVRLEMDNPGFTLRPGMFVDVEFPINLPPTVNVPVDAIMDSGLKQTVFVDRGNGYFEPRRVKTGWRLGDRVEIVEGLEPGERIVVSGNFLIDSESRMKLAAAGLFGEVTKDPVCGLNVDESKAKAAGFQNTFENQTYYFCSEACKQHFEKNPERYAGKPGEVPEAAGGVAGDKAQLRRPRPRTRCAARRLTKPRRRPPVSPAIMKGKRIIFAAITAISSLTKIRSVMCTRKPILSKAFRDPGRGKKRQRPGMRPGSGRGGSQTSRPNQRVPGQVYYFDTDGCKQRFDKDPQYYLSGNSEATLPAKYPLVPTNPDLLLRLRRDSIRAYLRGKAWPRSRSRPGNPR